MLLRCAAVCVVCGAVEAGAMCVGLSTSVVRDFVPVNSGWTENPCVFGRVTVVSMEQEPGLVDSHVQGVFVGLKPFTTYDIRVQNGDESFGTASAFTTTFFGLALVQFSRLDQPMPLTIDTMVDVFIDEDFDTLSVSWSEARAGAQE